MKEPEALWLRRRDIILAYTFLRIVLGVNFFNHGFTRMGKLYSMREIVSINLAIALLTISGYSAINKCPAVGK